MNKFGYLQNKLSNTLWVRVGDSVLWRVGGGGLIRDVYFATGGMISKQDSYIRRSLRVGVSYEPL